jgi:hypothetical protein
MYLQVAHAPAATANWTDTGFAATLYLEIVHTWTGATVRQVLSAACCCCTSFRRGFFLWLALVLARRARIQDVRAPSIGCAGSIKVCPPRGRDERAKANERWRQRWCWCPTTTPTATAAANARWPCPSRRALRGGHPFARPENSSESVVCEKMQPTLTAEFRPPAPNHRVKCDFGKHPGKRKLVNLQVSVLVHLGGCRRQTRNLIICLFFSGAGWEEFSCYGVWRFGPSVT